MVALGLHLGCSREITWQRERKGSFRSPWECDGILFPSSFPCMTGSRSPPRPFPRIPFSVWMRELLTALVSFLSSLFLVFFYLPLVMLYHSRIRFDIDALFSSKIELPPAKRRKGLAGSIVSTALSAALIGTAVGLTVYRL